MKKGICHVIILLSVIATVLCEFHYYRPPIIIGQKQEGKTKSKDACLPADGECYDFTVCDEKTIKVDKENRAVNGHDDLICEGEHEVCCKASQLRINEISMKYGDASEYANRRSTPEMNLPKKDL